MGRLIKLVLLLALVVGAAGAISFAGAFIKMKSYLGDNLPQLGPRTATFVPRAEELGGKPLWKFQYSNTQIQGLRSITVYVSLTGAILGTSPGNLSARLEPHRREMP